MSRHLARLKQLQRRSDRNADTDEAREYHCYTSPSARLLAQCHLAFVIGQDGQSGHDIIEQIDCPDEAAWTALCLVRPIAAGDVKSAAALDPNRSIIDDRAQSTLRTRQGRTRTWWRRVRHSLNEGKVTQQQWERAIDAVRLSDKAYGPSVANRE